MISQKPSNPVRQSSSPLQDIMTAFDGIQRFRLGRSQIDAPRNAPTSGASEAAVGELEFPNLLGPGGSARNQRVAIPFPDRR